MDEATKRKTYFLLAATTIIWGIQPLCIKWLVTTWSPVTITAMRYYLIGTTLLALSVYRGERLLPMWTFVETLQRRSADASDMIVQMYNANRLQLASWFERELGALPVESRERTLNALAMALAPESWVVLRQRLGLGVDQARDELGFVSRAIFNGAPRA